MGYNFFQKMTKNRSLEIKRSKISEIGHFNAFELSSVTSGLNKVNPEKNFGEYIFSEKWPKTDQCGLKGSKISKIDQFNELKSSYKFF